MYELVVAAAVTGTINVLLGFVIFSPEIYISIFFRKE
jgi:hypothetical protein